MKPKTRFFSQKMVIFPKISLKSFIHDLTQTLYFLNNRTKEIFGKYIVDRIFPYQVLTDTDSMLLFIIFIWKPESSIPNSNFRDLLFEAYINNEIINRFDTSHKFWGKFDARNKSLKRNLVIIKLSI